MRAAENGRLIRIAIAASLAVHLIFATLLHPHPVQAQPSQQPAPTTIIHLVPPPKPTPPPPVPHKFVHPHHAMRAHRLPMRLVHSLNRTKDAKSVAVVLPPEPTGIPQPPDEGTPAPGAGATDGPVEPAATPKPACSAPDVAARTIAVRSPVTPDDAAQSGATAKIRVDLDATGSVVGVSVYESAGSMQLDRAAIDAARNSRYAPEERECKNVPGSYLFTVDFSTM
jgi:protein TonB